MVTQLAKVSFIILLLVCENFSLKISFNTFFIFVYVYTGGKSNDQPLVNGSLNLELIEENILKPTSRPVEFMDAIFTLYQKKNGRRQKTPLLLSTEDMTRWKMKKKLI